MPKSDGIRQIAWLDCPGGGQVVVDGRFAFIGHMAAPHGTSVVDIADPRHPHIVAEIDIPAGLHSHKVRVANEIMITNRERHGGAGVPAGDFVGLRIFDVANPHVPREIARWECGGMGVHRFTFDGRYAYISPELDGYVGNVVMILDLADPAHPREIGRWWMPGQHVAGGETPNWEGRAHRCHHPIRRGDRLYVSYWHGGAVILDIAEMTRPQLVSWFDTSPPFAWPTHSVVPIEQAIAGQRWMLVADEHVAPLSPDLSSEMPSFIWMVNITEETRPIPVGSFQVPELVGRKNRLMTGCHQPVETIPGTEVAAAWFASGLRIIDISNPHALRQVACYVPDPPPGTDRPSSNDLFIDQRGLIYLIDRNRGLSILERI
ncbi:MAG TPA: hypothetical protein VLI93_00560 [Acetobacteraceae bacterium]|nr:hypothetical protein [Acetobacteraceae bacterium]